MDQTLAEVRAEPVDVVGTSVSGHAAIRRGSGRPSSHSSVAGSIVVARLNRTPRRPKLGGVWLSGHGLLPGLEAVDHELPAQARGLLGEDRVGALQVAHHGHPASLPTRNVPPALTPTRQASVSLVERLQPGVVVGAPVEQPRVAPVGARERGRRSRPPRRPRERPPTRRRPAARRTGRCVVERRPEDVVAEDVALEGESHSRGQVGRVGRPADVRGEARRACGRRTTSRRVRRPAGRLRVRRPSVRGRPGPASTSASCGLMRRTSGSRTCPSKASFR